MERNKMRYENSICDGCKKEFNQGEDIVVCPECGTPQHRKCYEENNECVNAALHETGFVWQGEVTTPVSEEKKKKQNEEQQLVCPSCGHENPPGSPFCEVCGQKFTFFGVNLLEKEQRLNREIDEDDRLNEEMLDVQNNILNGTATGADIERMLDARAKIVAPGLTKEQEQEIICSNPIKRVLVFVSSNAVRYVNKFRKIESTGSLTWNWAAFFFSPFWFFYRKLYKAGAVFLTLRVAISIIMLPLMEKFQSFSAAVLEAAKNSTTDAAFAAAYNNFLQASFPVYVLCILTVALSVVSALIADRLYKKYVTRVLNEAAQISDPLIFSHFFLRNSAVNPHAAFFALAAVYIIPNIVMFFIQ